MFAAPIIPANLSSRTEARGAVQLTQATNRLRGVPRVGTGEVTLEGAAGAGCVTPLLQADSREERRRVRHGVGPEVGRLGILVSGGPAIAEARAQEVTTQQVKLGHALGGRVRSRTAADAARASR